MVGRSMLTVACTYYEGKDVPGHSKGVFTPEWADKLYRGVRRNYSGEMRFVCLTDEPRSSFSEPVETLGFKTYRDNHWCVIECLRVTGNPVLFMGLDTVITGPIDEIVNFKTNFAMIRDPYLKDKLCSGVMMWNDVTHLYDKFLEEQNKREFYLGRHPSDQVWLREQGKPDDLDAAFPGQIRSYKAHILPNGIGDARIVYFHGRKKPHEEDHELIRSHWQ